MGGERRSEWVKDGEMDGEMGVAMDGEMGVAMGEEKNLIRELPDN